MDYSRYYQNWHTNTDEHYRDMINSYKVMLQEYTSKYKKDSKILEIGSGMGFCLLALKELGFTNITGVDLDKEQTRIAKNRGLNVYHTPVEDFFEIQSEKFDLILMFDVLEHINKEKIMPLLKIIHNNLQVNGALVVQTPNCYSVAGAAFRYVDFTHEISFSTYSLDFVLYNTGFKKIKIVEANPLPILSKKKIFCCPRTFISEAKRVIARKIYKFLLSQEIGNLDDVPLSANILAIANK